MTLSDKFGLVVLSLTWATQIFRPQLLRKYSKLSWSLGLIGIFGSSFYNSFVQYEIWLKNPLGKFFLPPYSNFDYFFSYIFYHFWASAIIAFLTALLVKNLIIFFNERFEKKFFRKGEVDLLGLGIFLDGYPGFFFYIIFILLGGFFLTFYFSLFKRERAPLYYLWLPLAILAIIGKNWLVFSQIFNILNF